MLHHVAISLHPRIVVNRQVVLLFHQAANFRSVAEVLHALLPTLNPHIQDQKSCNEGKNCKLKIDYCLKNIHRADTTGSGKHNRNRQTTDDWTKDRT